MKKLVLVIAALALVGAGCSSAQQPPTTPAKPSQEKPAVQNNAYPGTEPYVAPSTPPPSIQPN